MGNRESRSFAPLTPFTMNRESGTKRASSRMTIHWGMGGCGEARLVLGMTIQEQKQIQEQQEQVSCPDFSCLPVVSASCIDTSYRLRVSALLSDRGHDGEVEGDHQ